MQMAVATTDQKPNEKPKPRVLMLGPMPPPAGGMATVMDNLRGSALAEKCRLTVLNNGKTTPEGRSLLTGIAAQTRLLGRLLVSLLAHRPQIVHTHTCSGFSFWRDSLHVMVSRLLRRQVIWHIHGGYFEQFAAAMGGCRRWLLRHALHSGSAVIVLGDNWVTRLKRFAPSARWRVVPNGVRVPPGHVERENSTPRFLFLGNLDKEKGALDLVSAVPLASRVGFCGEVHLAGGETMPGQKDDLVRRIRESGGESRIRLLGIIVGEEKEKALASADCLVLPSYAEGLPMAMLEAMAYGMPVIASRVGAIPEVVTDGVEGFLIEPGDVAALADRLVQMERNPSLRHRMGLAARKRVEQGYSIETMVERLMAVYNEVLTRPQG